MYSLVNFSQFHVQTLQPIEEFPLVRPHVELPVELWHHEVSLPAPQLFGLEHVSEDVVAEVEDVSPLSADHLGQHLARAAAVDHPLLDGSGVATDHQISGGLLHLSWTDKSSS